MNKSSLVNALVDQCKQLMCLFPEFFISPTFHKFDPMVNWIKTHYKFNKDISNSVALILNNKHLITEEMCIEAQKNTIRYFLKKYAEFSLYSDPERFLKYSLESECSRSLIRHIKENRIPKELVLVK